MHSYDVTHSETGGEFATARARSNFSLGMRPNRRPAHKKMPLRKYNPAFLSDSELIDGFCVRRVEFQLLVETLRETEGDSNVHRIVIGPRGSGKTTLLLRVVLEVGRDQELSDKFFALVLPEERYEVATPGEFWIECLRLP